MARLSKTQAREGSIRRRMSDPDTVIEAIWHLLATLHPAYRAAGILLLKEYTADLAASGQGERASEIVAWFREHDPGIYLRLADSDHIVP